MGKFTQLIQNQTFLHFEHPYCSSSDIMEITPDLIFDNSDTDDSETKDVFTCPREPIPEKRWSDNEIRETKW